jgi:putative transposase
MTRIILFLKWLKLLKIGRLDILDKSFRQLMKLPSLWTYSYMFDTTGKISTQKVLDYLNDPHHG